MPNDEEGQDQGGDPIDDAIAGAEGDPTPASTTLTSEAVRSSPEYRALKAENRRLARKAGTSEAAAAAARAAAETERLAAEAMQQAALDAEITAALGEEGVAFWAEFAELSQTNPVAAAKRLAAFRTAGAAAQSAATGADAEAGDPAAGEGTTVPAQTPPPPSLGVDGAQPLGQQAEQTPDQVVAALTKTFTDTVERVQNPVTRNRVTMRDRASGFISYLGAAYVAARGNETADRRR